MRVRFCPSPTGTPHVGLIRTALFNWAYARHTGGTFVFRIEDTDAARDSEESYAPLLDALRWLGLDWDEGPEVGGPHGPYRQSRAPRHLPRRASQRLLAAGDVYECYSTPEEIEARNGAAGRDPKLGYDNFDRDLTDEQRQALPRRGPRAGAAAADARRRPHLDDLVRGEITFPAGIVPDFALVRANGDPLYTLVNPVDDALMGITHVLRGEDLLLVHPAPDRAVRGAASTSASPSSRRSSGTCPTSWARATRSCPSATRSPTCSCYRDHGFIPEGLLNYLALLGWSIADDRDVFSLDEMVAGVRRRATSTPTRPAST